MSRTARGGPGGRHTTNGQVHDEHSSGHRDGPTEVNGAAPREGGQVQLPSDAGHPALPAQVPSTGVSRVLGQLLTCLGPDVEHLPSSLFCAFQSLWGTGLRMWSGRLTSMPDTQGSRDCEVHALCFKRIWARAVVRAVVSVAASGVRWSLLGGGEKGG